MIEPCLSFDSGRKIGSSGICAPNGLSETTVTQERSIYEFKDALMSREFDVEVISERGAISAVLLYPKDANKGGYETAREKMETSAKEIERWLIKHFSNICAGEVVIHGEFDPRSWCSYAVLEFRSKSHSGATD